MHSRLSYAYTYIYMYIVYIYIYTFVTRVSLTWSSCSWRVNYKVEPTIPSLAKRNRWIQLAWVGARRILVCIRSPERCVFMRHGWMEKRFDSWGPLWLISAFDHPPSLQEIKSYGSSFNYHPRIYLCNLLMGRRSMERLRSRSIRCAVRSLGEGEVSFFFLNIVQTSKLERKAT